MTKVFELLLKHLGYPIAKLLLGKLISWFKKKLAERKGKARIKESVKQLKESGKSNDEIIAALRNLMP